MSEEAAPKKKAGHAYGLLVTGIMMVAAALAAAWVAFATKPGETPAFLDYLKPLFARSAAKK